MGKVDEIVSPYIRKKKNFCGLINGFVYHGKTVLKPENIVPLERERQIPLEAEGKSKNNKTKKSVIYDARMQAGVKGTYIVFACENQKEVHYGMPVRMMLYEAVEYAQQLKELNKVHKEEKNLKNSAEYLSGMKKDDKLHMIVPVVFYYGEEPWDGPITLKEMIAFPEEMDELKEYLPNYMIHLIEPDKVDPNDFPGDWKIIMEILSLQKDKQKLMNYLNTYEENINKLQRDSQMALLAMIGGEEKLFQEEKGGDITMCTALRELMRDSEEIGMQKGMQKGIQYGMENMMKLIRKLSEYGKMEELDKVIAEEISIEQLMKQYGISD